MYSLALGIRKASEAPQTGCQALRHLGSQLAMRQQHVASDEVHRLRFFIPTLPMRCRRDPSAVHHLGKCKTDFDRISAAEETRYFELYEGGLSWVHARQSLHPTLPWHDLALDPAHQQIEDIGDDTNDHDAHDDDVSAQEIGRIEHHLS